MKIVKTAVFSAMIGATNAWWGTGHLLVARIANNLLEKQSPSTLSNVESLLKVLELSDPTYTKDEGNHPFVECTTFADDIKNKGGAYQSGWHFVDQPYLD
jgi:hypothetical protein